jgi:hypothetical protein
MSPNELAAADPAIAAVRKFYHLNDDLDAVQAVLRKMFFEYLRTKPNLSTEEIDILNTVSVLLAELNAAGRNRNAV